LNKGKPSVREKFIPGDNKSKDGITEFTDMLEDHASRFSDKPAFASNEFHVCPAAGGAMDMPVFLSDGLFFRFAHKGLKIMG
jgi:hypothetical protein